MAKAPASVHDVQIGRTTDCRTVRFGLSCIVCKEQQRDMEKGYMISPRDKNW